LEISSGILIDKVDMRHLISLISYDI
jgi:hypothetical protein